MAHTDDHPLVATKLSPQQLGDYAIHRPALVERLRTGSGRLTMVSAPAGWGKTMLLTQVVEALRVDQRVAFMSLDL